MNKVVILAAGRGTRMRREVPGVRPDKTQERLAAQGLKGLIPIHGHPYLDYVISAAADAGLCDVCLVVGPGSDAIRAHYQSTSAERVRIEFAVQREPLGSAHALLSAELFAGDDPFLVINSDNYYPARTLAALRELRGSGMAGFQSRVLFPKVTSRKSGSRPMRSLRPTPRATSPRLSRSRMPPRWADPKFPAAAGSA